MLHPIIPVLRSHFKACSEEYGETAIHTLMTHVREWNYTGENMTKRWQESSAASWCFDVTQIPRSHRSTGTKWFEMDDPNDMMVLLSEKFIEIVNQAKNNVSVALIGTPGFSRESQESLNLAYWEDFSDSHELSFISASEQVPKLEKKIRKHLQREAMQTVDVELFYS